MIQIKAYKKYLSLALVLSVLALVLIGCDEVDLGEDFSPTGERLEAHFIDVGQGDSTLVKLPNGEIVLIDGGPRSSRDKLLSYLEDHKIDRIDYLVATHPHEDHIGGLPEVIDSLDIGKVYMPDRTANTKIFESLLESIKNKDLKIDLAKAGDLLVDEDGLKVEFLGPVRTDYDKTNNHSIVTRIQYGKKSLLVMGDAEVEAEKDIVLGGGNLKSDVLRVGHHGSSTSSTMDFLDKVEASDYVISLGKNNTYGHPHVETMDNIGLKNGKVYRTDELGDIIMVSDGESLEFDRESKKVDLEDSGPYIGNKNTEIYHSEDCSYLPGEANRIIFNSKKEALESGFRAHSCVK